MTTPSSPSAICFIHGRGSLFLLVSAKKQVLNLYLGFSKNLWREFRALMTLYKEKFTSLFTLTFENLASFFFH